MTTFLQDVRYALRSLAKSPGFAAAAVVTLALGIGANTAVFAVIDAVLMRPLPLRDAGALVLSQTIQKESRQPWGTSPPDFYALRQRNRSLDGLAAFYNQPANLTGAQVPERLPALVVSSNFFAVLGERPAVGRVFTMADEEWGSHRVAVLTDGLWRRRFGGDPAVLGRTIRLDFSPYTIVGVLPPGFSFAGTSAELYLPMSFAPGDNLNTHNNYFLTMVGRIKPGVTLSAALADVNGIMAAIEREFPENKGLGADMTPLREAIVRGARPALLVLMGAVGLVLLIACANLANLLLARSVGRRREVAIRAALGAGRRRLLRQFLTEGAVLAGLGGCAGLLLAAWSVGAARLLSPSVLPRGGEIRLDASILAFALGVTVLTGLLFGLAPALHAARVDLNESLKERTGSSGAGSGRRSLRGTLVVAEVALSLVLLVGAALMLKTVDSLLRVEAGFDPRGVLTAEIDLPREKYIDDRLARAFSPEANAGASRFFDSVVERVAALPGVTAAGLVSGLPLAGENWGKTVTFYDRPLPANVRDLPAIQYRVVAGDYFRAAGIPVLAGRAFTARDTLHSPPVAIVSREMARRYWKGQDPIGRILSVNPPKELLPPESLPPNYPGPRKLTVVGLAGDVRYGGLARAPLPVVYAPYSQGAEGTTAMFLVARAENDPLALVGAVRRGIAGVDPDQPIANVATMESRVAGSILQPRLVSLLLAGFAAIAALMAAVGIYGVMWSSVRRRTAEIGIRMALGADPARVLSEVLARGLRLTAAGVGIGIAAALLGSRALASLLFGVAATDPLLYGSAVLVLTGVAVAACYLPARRAARVDPMSTLRAE